MQEKSETSAKVRKARSGKPEGKGKPDRSKTPKGRKNTAQTPMRDAAAETPKA